MGHTDDLLEGFELHSPEKIRAAIAAGADAKAPIDGKKPIEVLTEMYLRSKRFAECVRVMLEAGATLDDPLLEAILLDDDAAIAQITATRAAEPRKEISHGVRLHFAARSFAAARLRGVRQRQSACGRCWRRVPM